MSGNKSMLTSITLPVEATLKTTTTTAPSKSIITEVETKIEGAFSSKVVNTKRVALLKENNLSSDFMASMVLMASNDGLNRNIGSTLLTLRNVSGYANNHNNNNYSVKNSYNNNCHNESSNCSNEDCNNNTNVNNNYNDNSQKVICNSNSSNMTESHKTDHNNKSNNNNSNLPEPGPGPPGEHILSTNVRNALASISTNNNPYVTDVYVMTNGNNFLLNNNNTNNNNNNNNNNFQNSRYQSKTAILQALQQCHLQQQQQQQTTTFQQITNLQDQQNAEHLMPTAQLLHAFNQPQQQQPHALNQRHNNNNNNNNNNNSDSSSNNDHISAHGMQCGFCCQPISDRYIMRVMDTYFHEACLKCANCSLNLVHSCFTRDGKLYCRIDYERLFLRNRCLGCGRNIAADELVMRTLENVFHLKCFACVVCGTVLKKGEQYVVRQGQLFCRFDYEKEVEMLQGYDYYADDLFPPKLDGRRGPKRPRTILNTQQRRAFKASFELSPKPCRKVRENLAKDTGLSLRIVQVWFQNQRAKVKKIQKKAKVEPAKSVADSQDSLESDSSLAKIKDEAHSDNESLLESPFSVCGTISNSSEAVNKLTCMKEEHDKMPFNCMETNKENCNKTNEPILNTILGLSYATFQQLGTYNPTPMINPIDRLYSMQNSYFRPEELAFGDCDKNGNNL